MTTPVPVGDGLRQEQLDILRRYKAAGIIAKLPDLSGACDSSFPLDP
jgi:hypothetical protein